MPHKILVVDDEVEIADLIETYLADENYTIFKFYSARAALACIETTDLDLAILDVMLPDIDGFALCKKIRESHTWPIIMLTAKDAETDKITGLTLGADDYVTKPYNIPVLLARIRAVLRRVGGQAESDTLEAGELKLHLTRGTASAGEKSVELTRNELKILAYLMGNPGQIVPRADLIDALWDSQIYIDDNTLSVNITRLRSKLEEIGLPGFIKTRRGMGYQL